VNFRNSYLDLGRFEVFREHGLECRDCQLHGQSQRQPLDVQAAQ